MAFLLVDDGWPWLRPASLSLGRIGQVEKPGEQREAISATESESGGVWRERSDERGGIVDLYADRLRDDQRDRFGIFVLAEEVGGDA